MDVDPGPPFLSDGTCFMCLAKFKEHTAEGLAECTRNEREFAEAETQRRDETLKNAEADRLRFASDAAAGPCPKFPSCRCGRCEAHRGEEPCRVCGGWGRQADPWGCWGCGPEVVA